MTPASIDSLGALEKECELVSRAALRLEEEDFARQTRCTEWNVGELLAHMYRDVERTIVGLAQPPPAREPDTDSVSYWRSYSPVGDAPDIADRAKQRWASYGRGHDLAVVWDDMWRRALERAAGADRNRTVTTWGPILTLEEFLRTRVLEMTVHGMDLAGALDRDPWPTEGGLAVTAEILKGLLGTEPPTGLGWDRPAFIERGSGRVELSSEERETLGALSDRFPLMG